MMISERAAAYVLAILCVFQALGPAWTIRSHCRRNIDVRMGWLRVQVRKDPLQVCFEGVTSKKEEGEICSSERPTSVFQGRSRDLHRLRICMSDSGCMTAWLEGSSYGWSISKHRGENFEERLTSLDRRETSVSGD